MPNVDPTQAQLLYAGNIADDDLMWIVRCSISELHNLILTPQPWVASLGELSNWNPQVPSPVLAKDFAMTVSESTVDDPEGWVTVQGISNTNALTLFAPSGSAVQSALLTPAFKGSVQGSTGDPLQAFWDSIALDTTKEPPQLKTLPVNVVMAMARFYGHFEILNGDESQPERAAKIATFLLACSEDPAGLSKMLGTLPQVTQYIKDGSAETGPAITFAAPVTPPSDPVYASMGDPIEISCLLVDGQYQPPEGTGGTGTPDGTVVKRYGIDPPPGS